MSDDNLLPSEPSEETQQQAETDQESAPQEEPELILGKFKSNEDLQGSYVQLEKKLGGFTGAPESYEMPEDVDSEDVFVQKLSEMGAQHNMSQNMFNELLEFGDQILTTKEELNREREMEALGENAEDRLNNIDGFLRNNLGDKYEELAGVINNAKTVELVESLIKATRPSAMPTTPAAPVNVVTQEEIERMMTERDDTGRVIYSYSKERQRAVQDAFDQMAG